MCATIGRSHSVLSSYFHLCLLCFLVCVHHGHQAENLSQDISKIGSNQSSSGKAEPFMDNPMDLRPPELHHEHEDDHDHENHTGPDNIDESKVSECRVLLTHHDKIHSEHHDHHHDEDGGESPSITDFKLWMSATTAIIVISLCGIFGVMVIPIMQKVFYQHLIQFLVALAIGSMLGDAFLHLIPHALAPRSHHSHGNADHGLESHTSHVWSGFVALVTLVLFFLVEKMINMLGEWREHQRAMTREKKVRVVRTGHKASSRAVGERLCKHKYSAYCVADIDDVTEPQESCQIDTNKDEVHRENEQTVVAVSSHSPLLAAKSESHESLHQQQKETFSISKSVPAVSFAKQAAATDAEQQLSMPNSEPPHENGDDLTACQNWWNPEDRPDTANSSQYDTVFIREHEHSHHGHSHAHSHLHSAPDSIASVAWMVIVGDGIHNLADGLAVGAAFTENFMSGLSTSIAVLCHELPHEVGDFAMLLKAGMSVKQAIFYNFLSSVLAFIGMIIGVILGNLEHLTPWIFMGTAGIFMYVALVDMIPELNSGHAHPYTAHAQHEARSMELGLQILGMSTGILIMLMIALYEHDLKDAFVAMGGN